MTGDVVIDGQTPPVVANLRTEILGGDPLPEDAHSDPQYARLVNSIPRVYLRRLDRENPGQFIRLGSVAVVKLSEEGIRYLRESRD